MQQTHKRGTWGVHAAKKAVDDHPRYLLYPVFFLTEVVNLFLCYWLRDRVAQAQPSELGSTPPTHSLVDFTPPMALLSTYVQCFLIYISSLALSSKLQASGFSISFLQCVSNSYRKFSSSKMNPNSAHITTPNLLHPLSENNNSANQAKTLESPLAPLFFIYFLFMLSGNPINCYH